MGKIFCITGKSASGKDAIYNALINNKALNLKPYVGYTTRPMRSGEENGREYFFTSVKELEDFEKAGKLIEKRVYHTIYGDWYYYSVDSGNADPAENSCLYIGTLESFIKMRRFYGEETVIPIYVEVEDGERLIRAVKREQRQQNPGYEELCRRFLADSADFSSEKLKEAKITRKFDNTDFDRCIAEITDFIISNA